MTLLDLLNKLAGAGDELVEFLTRAKLAAPDLAPLVDEWLIRLNQAISVQSLIALATALPKELGDIAQGKIKPKDHPSDLA